jgi:hypothetical protein
MIAAKAQYKMCISHIASTLNCETSMQHQLTHGGITAVNAAIAE